MKFASYPVRLPRPRHAHNAMTNLLSCEKVNNQRSVLAKRFHPLQYGYRMEDPVATLLIKVSTRQPIIR